LGGGKPFGSSGRGAIIPPKRYRGFDDSRIPDKKYFEELKRVSKNQIIFGGNYFIEHLSNTPCFIIWDKDNSGNFADAELAWTSFKTATRIFKYRWNGMLQQNMKNKEERIHPTQKPVALYDWIINNYAKAGDKIIDTHLGSGSSRIAAYKNGIYFVGCEKDEGHFEQQEQRFNKFIKQQTLFPAG
jgi:site-specific DNA-methyltransferase (adenine-specific)